MTKLYVSKKEQKRKMENKQVKKKFKKLIQEIQHMTNKNTRIRKQGGKEIKLYLKII